ncbi:ABC transporter substrate-binding protein [Boudabousia marimammalium]|uniref:BMP family ABC transporter substrate-binding protein n=1 Tax=Boudabousia marimammalium TaxID=156892 RepID=A0A1Q5PSU4_9ACTO|nr:ABC transporter substrate-binding protein [Boudabousia marimammalium]OKL50440.1 BMP family ABC transporter substrate-binding protein [Boudabousia marimammalium]
MRFGKVVLAAALSTALLAGCASTGGDAGSGSSEGGEGQKTIYLVSKGFQHRFWQAVKEGAEKAGAENGYKVEFVGPENEQQVNQQLDQLKIALNSKPAAIGFAALDSGAAEPILMQIKAAGIPVVAFDSGVDSDIPVTTVQTDNKAAAAAAAEKMAEKLGNQGTVGLVCHDQTSQTGKERCFGFKDWLKENAPNIKVIDEQYAGEAGKAADAAKALLTANPDIVGIYGTNEAAATGVVQGVQEAGKTGNVMIIGFDSGKAQIDAIRSGLEAGAITQSPVKMGYETVMSAIKAIKGESLEKVIDSGFVYYDKDNMDSDEVKPNLYE